MSAKTKIVVLRMKELIYAVLFAALGLLLVILLAVMLNSAKKDDAASTSATAPTSLYIPGVYTTELVLGGQTVNVEVIVDKDSITSIRLQNLSESVTTLYPLLEPTLDSICTQIYETQSLESITYTTESKYTSMVLLEAISGALEKAENIAE